MPHPAGKSIKFHPVVLPITGREPFLERTHGQLVGAIGAMSQAGGIETMKTTRRWQNLSAAGLVAATTALSGCQTWIAGMTLPSGRYLEHPPQFFAPSPTFPLARELAAQEAAAAAVPPVAGAVPPPAPVPGIPAPRPAVEAPPVAQPPLR